MHKAPSFATFHRPPLTAVTWTLVAFLASAACTGASLAFAREAGQFAAIWPANAVILALMLRAPRPFRLWMIVAGYVGMVAASSALAAWALGDAAVLYSANVVELLLCLAVLERMAPRGLDFTRGRDLLLFCGLTMLAPAVSASLSVLAVSVMGLPASPWSWMIWFARNLMGLLVVTPALLMISPRRMRTRRRRSWRWGDVLVGALLLAVLAAVFSQSRYPLLFLIPPALVLVAFRRGAFGGALGLLVTAAVSMSATVAQSGPIMLIPGSLTIRVLVLQGFLIAMAASTLPVAAALARQRRLMISLKKARSRADRHRREAEASERRYRLMADNATDMIVRYAPSGRILFVSPASLQVQGYAPDALIGRFLQDFIHPDDMQRLIENARRLMASEEAERRPIEFRSRMPDGEWHWFETNPSVRRDDQGAPVEFIDVMRNITARKEAEAELAAARAAAGQAAIAKADFLGAMNHELRTPLTSIIGFSDLLVESEALPAAEHRYAECVRLAAGNLFGLINDILDFSRIDSGSLRLEPEVVSPTDLFAETIALVEEAARAKGLDLRLNIDPSATAPVMVDPQRLRQITLNFLANAVKFTLQGAVTLTVSRVDGLLRVEVADTGPGVDENQRAALFERFSQGDNSRTRSHGGTGLGLAICRGLALAMGGQAGYSPGARGGSIFWCEVAAPAAPMEMEAAG
ncbi:sensor histidine kinase [Caulobacter sp. NIBR2454]|uniref:sensor histidine kinase n=1 Tax=Caulobacter sp. NIBR2454 TaxID=3015996 RepID=UPI0022B6B13F|nr:ATP-binding protein [Caulobacter sp. NIBR2454]